MSDFANYVATTSNPAQPAPGFLSKNIGQPIAQAFNSGVDQVKSGFSKASSASSNPSFLGGVGQLFSGTADMISGVGSAAAAPLAPVLQRPLGAATNAVSNTISNSPTVQRFAMSPAGQTTANIAQGINSASNVVGTVAGGMAVGDSLGNIWSKAYNRPPGGALSPELSQIVDNHLTSANQVLGDSETMTAMKAQPADVLNHAQTNIADSLEAAGEKDLANKVRAIDTSNMTDPAQLKTQIDSLSAPKGKLAAATAERNAAATTGVKSLNQMTQQVGGFKNDLGTNFKAGAQAIETSNPEARLNLSNEQLDALQTLKNNKSFNLPDYLKKDYTPEELNDIHTHGALTPTQAQDLITQLNKSTFTEKASGLGVDQTKIGLTNEIKDAAKQAFGPEWSKVYENYSKGINAVNSLNDIVNLDKDATPTDINKSLNSVLKLGKTPEGKIILQNAVNEFKKTSGIDLSDATTAIHQITDKEIALSEAEKGGFVKQFMKGATSPSGLGRRIAGGVISVGILYPLIREIEKTLKQ